jgi:hypothetical protein
MLCHLAFPPFPPLFVILSLLSGVRLHVQGVNSMNGAGNLSLSMSPYAYTYGRPQPSIIDLFLMDTTATRNALSIKKPIIMDKMIDI